MIQFRLSYSHWRLALTRYGWDWKGVERWQVAMVLYSCSMCLTIGFCPGSLNMSLSRASSMLDGWPTILQRALFFPPLIPLSHYIYSFSAMRVSFFRRASIFLNFYLPLGFSRSLSSPFSLANAGSLYIFRELLSSTLLISSSAHIPRGQGADWAVQTSNGGENEKKFSLFRDIKACRSVKVPHFRVELREIRAFYPSYCPRSAIFNKRNITFRRPDIRCDAYRTFANFICHRQPVPMLSR